MLHLYLYFKIVNKPLGSGLVYILGMGYDRWVITVNAACLYRHTDESSEELAFHSAYP